ncbi:MAG TPA: OsmC family protein [Nocardioidaceae bacterium]|nr:OsmC family protein [Nocardioidaceae bacterium]
MRAVVQAGEFEIVVDEPEYSGGTNTGPPPTDLLLASIASCMTLAFAFVAKKRGIELSGLDVTAVGVYRGPGFERIALSVTANVPRDVLEELRPDAMRLCYVSNTFREQPDLTVTIG